MQRLLERKLMLVVALAALLAGGAIAAVTATGHGASHRHARTHRAGAQGRRGLALDAAASYLGIPAATLAQDLRSGRSLAEVAAATPGKSEAGLIAAIVAAGDQRLRAAAGRLPQHVSELVRHKGLVAAGHGARHAVLAYLGLDAARLRSRLHAGLSLAQIADATPGRSAQGLVEAIVAARRARLDAAVKAGRMSQAHESERLSALAKRIDALVHRARSH